jgi:hypothetical protein
MDTNALLALTISVIANFTNCVDIPLECFPKIGANISKYGAGDGPYFPTDVGLVLTNGARYSVGHGSVRTFIAPHSYANSTGGHPTADFFGEVRMTTNEAITLATAAVRCLARDPASLDNSVMVFYGPVAISGKTIPFYDLTWYQTNTAHPGRLNVSLARVEVDAGRRQISYISLWHQAFGDEARDEEIRRLVHAPEPPIRPRPKDKTHPRAPTNDVVQAIQNWLVVCQRMHIDPGTQTNLADVDWEDTYVFEASGYRPPRISCHIGLQSGAHFTAIGDYVYAYAAADKYFPMEAWKWKRFLGPINHRWEDLAKRYQEMLIAEFRFPQSAFTNLTARLREGYADEGRPQRVNRAEPVWFAPGSAQRSSQKPVFQVEFDLATGAIKGFAFTDERWAEMFWQTQRAAAK